MNLKKFISGVSALAIAASAFAAMAVTANAADVSNSIYGKIIGIDFGDTNSSSPYANTVDLSSATISGYTYTAGDGDFPDTDTANITTSETTFNDNDTPAGANHYIVKNVTKDVTIPSGLRVDATKDKVNFKFKYVFGSLSGRLAGFFIKDEDGTDLVAYYSSRYSGISTSGTVNTLGLTSALGGSLTKNGATWSNPLDIDITLDYSTKSVTAVIEGTEYTQDLSSSAKAPATFEVKSNYNNSARYSLFDDLEITNIEGTATTLYPYTVNYTLSGTTVDSDTGSKIDGASVEARTGYFDYTDSTTGETTRYYIEDGATTSFTIDSAGTNVFNVPVRAADVYTVSAVTSSGAVLKAATSVKEGDTFSYTYPKYLTDANNRVTSVIDGASTYGKTETPSDDTTYTVAYTAYAGTAYFYEAESNGGNAGISSNTYSNGSAVRRLDQRQVKITVPETGVYSVTIGFACDRNDNSATDTLSVYNGNYSAEATPIYQVTDTRYNTYHGSSDTHSNISLTAGDTLTLYTASWNLGADYVLLEKSVVAAVASTPQILGTYTTSPGDYARGFTFTVTPNDETITSVTVTDAADSTKTSTIGELNLSGKGEITFGILITASDAANLDKTFTVELN